MSTRKQLISMALFLYILGVFGVVQLGTFFHEFLHTADNSFKSEAMCIDLTGKNAAYVLATDATNGTMTKEQQYEKHFSIYYLHGLVEGILFVFLILISCLMTNFIMEATESNVYNRTHKSLNMSKHK